MILLTYEPLDLQDALRSVEDERLGGVVVFVGEVRSLTAGVETSKLIYEAYEDMALARMREIADEALEKWLGNVAMAHRLGELRPGEVAVVTAAACAHRPEAFESCRFLIESLKGDVPIWKREYGPEGEAWVEGERRLPL